MVRLYVNVQFKVKPLSTSTSSNQTKKSPKIPLFPSQRPSRRGFGTIEQVTWSYAISDTMTIFSYLQCPKVKTWKWTLELKQEVRKAKEEIVRRVENGVKTYNIKKMTCLSTD